MASQFVMKFNKDNAEISWWRDDADVVHFNVGAIGGKSVVNGVVYYRVRYIDADETEYHDILAQSLVTYHAEKIDQWEELYGIEWEAEHAMQVANEEAQIKSKKRRLTRPTASGTKRAKIIGKFLIRERNSSIDDLDETEDNSDETGEGTGAHHARESSADSVGDADEDYPGFSDGRDREMQIQQEAEAFFSQIIPDVPVVDEGGRLDNKGKDISCESITAELSKAYEQSLLVLTEAAIEIPGLPCDQWIKRARDQSNTYRGAWLKIKGVYILASMEDRVLKHLVDGDIPKAWCNDPAMRESMRSLRRVGDKGIAPSIYIQYLVDGRGESPTPQQLRNILNHIELYIERISQESHNWAMKVDKIIPQGSHLWTAEGAAAGRRRYVDGQDKDKPKDETRVPHVEAFVAAVRLRIKTLDPDKPLVRPLCEVGFATTPLERLEQHAKHQSSNYLMNLTDSTCRILYGQRFEIKQFVLFHMFEPVQAAIGEVLFSRISQCYTTYGGGFSHHAAGISTHNVWVLPTSYLQKKDEKVWGDETYLAKITRERDL